MSAAQKYWDFLRTCDLLWLGNINSLTSEFSFLVVASLSLFTTNCRKAGHTIYNTLLFLLLLFLLAAFFSFWNMKKDYCGLTKWLQHMKIWHGKGYFKYSIQQQCSKAGEKWHLEREVLSTLEVNNFLGSSPLFFCWRGTILLNIIRQFLIALFFSIFRTLRTLSRQMKGFFYWNGSKGTFRNNKKILKVKRWL